MKPQHKSSKLIALLLSVSVLMQSCVVYQSTSVSLEEAVKSESPVKITKNNGEKTVFSRVILDDDGWYYGKKFATSGKVTNKFLIDKNNIIRIQAKDKLLSTVLNVVVPLIMAGIIVHGFDPHALSI